MAECGGRNRKGTTLSDVTAKDEYGVSRDFIITGVAEQLGTAYLMKVKNQTELRKIKKEITKPEKRLDTLQRRKAALEEALKK